MSELFDLYQLQIIDLKIAGFEEILIELDDGSRLRDELVQLENDLAEMKKHFTHREGELHDKELELKGTEEKIKTLQKKMYGGKVSNSKELQDMDHDVKSMTKHKGKLEEDTLLLMEEVESASQRIKEAQEVVVAKKRTLSDIEADYQARSTSVTSQLDESLTHRKAALEKIEETLLHRYENLRQRCENVAVVKVETDLCPGCHTTITSYLYKQLKAGDDGIACENCHRLFYCEGAAETMTDDE